MNQRKSLVVLSPLVLGLLVSTFTAVQGFLLPIRSSNSKIALIASRSGQEKKRYDRTSLQESTTKEIKGGDDPIQIASEKFRTNPTPLYLEDTDAYGVMFNANYMKFYERALQTQLPFSSSSPKQNFIIKQVTKHKFKRAVTLDGYRSKEATKRERT